MNVLKQTFNLSHNKLSESVYDSHYNKIRDAVSKTHKVKYILTRHKKFHPVILSSLTDSKYVGVDNLSHYIKKKTVGYVRVTVKLSNRELLPALCAPATTIPGTSIFSAFKSARICSIASSFGCASVNRNAGFGLELPIVACLTFFSFL